MRKRPLECHPLVRSVACRSRKMRTQLAVVLALLPVSQPYSLPARQARPQLLRAAQRARRVALQEVEPDEYIPELDVDVRLPRCEEVL